MYVTDFSHPLYNFTQVTSRQIIFSQQDIYTFIIPHNFSSSVFMKQKDPGNAEYYPFFIRPLFSLPLLIYYSVRSFFKQLGSQLDNQPSNGAQHFVKTLEIFSKIQFFWHLKKTSNTSYIQLFIFQAFSTNVARIIWVFGKFQIFLTRVAYKKRTTQRTVQSGERVRERVKMLDKQIAFLSRHDEAYVIEP